ncbi:MAG: methyltransferase domain-containing protein [Burkholderiaceae bacterium]
MALNPTARHYAAATAAYEAGRPGYPAALLAALPLDSAACVVDLGAGTGKLTRLLAPRLAPGTRLIAVEPVAGMSAKLADVPAVEIVNARADDTGLPDGCADVVVCAQSFHWFDDEAAVAEIRRLLVPGGTLALMWNMRDERVEWVDALSKMIEAHAGDTPRHQTGRWRWVLDDPRFAFDQQIVVKHPHRMARDGVFERVASTSYIAGLPDVDRQRLRERTEAILREAGLGDAETVVLPYLSRLFLLTRR